MQLKFQLGRVPAQFHTGRVSRKVAGKPRRCLIRIFCFENIPPNIPPKTSSPLASNRQALGAWLKEFTGFVTGERHAGLALCGVRADKRLNLRPDGALCHADVIVALQIEPDFRGYAEIFAEA